VNPLSEDDPRQRRSSARYQARLDAETSAKLAELVCTFHRTHSAILRFAMQWGLTQTQGWTIDQSIPATVQTVAMLLEPKLLQQMQDAAAAHGASVAAWVRHALRQVTPNDFPASWHVEALQGSKPRSHDSHLYPTRSMLRLNNETSEKLDTLTRSLDRPAAEVIRRLIAQATLEDFSQSWRMAVAERR
jgi:predicted DNA-binding protein